MLRGKLHCETSLPQPHPRLLNREPLTKLHVISPSAASEAEMFKAIAIIALGTVLTLPPMVAVAQTGYGTRPNSHPHSSFERSWSKGNESKDRARRSAEWVRHHHRNPF
jgi:hypothetical protein